MDIRPINITKSFIKKINEDNKLLDIKCNYKSIKIHNSIKLVSSSTNKKSNRLTILDIISE